ncbi:MAG: General transcriptional co-repressor, acts together with Tup1p, glucose repression mediator protein [Parcubacteria group bacterium]|nr:General transcriptional co-repressor, acts together with Tup1p, glucose repression mediator protein [Parcubacteria group bacterium]
MEENKIEIKAGNLSNHQENPVKKTYWFEKISYFSLLISSFLLPLFFIPLKFVSLEFSKVLMIVLGVLISLAFWSLARIKEGKFEFPATILSASSIFVILIYLLSSIFSENKMNSLIGNGFELGTFGLVFIGFVIMFIVSSIFRTKDKIFYSYIGLLISFLVIFLFQTTRLLLGADFLSFGIFTDITSNMVGKWNDLGIYFGLIAILSIATLLLTRLGKPMRFFLYFASIASLFFISLVNFKFVWFVIGIFALVFFIYSVSLRRGEAKSANTGNSPQNSKKVSYLILFFLIVSVVFIIDGFRSKHIIGDSFAGYFNISQFEVRPSFQGTSEILKANLKENPIFGSGPNRFVNSWLLFKPDGVNNTIFWNFDFNYGVGIIPTFITTTGALGMISWILFLGVFLYTGFRYIFIKTSNQFSRYLIVSSFLASLYLWIVNVLYVPSAAIFFSSFFFTGLFIGALINENLIPMKNFPYLGNPRRSLISMPILVVIIISSATGGYIYLQRFLSNVYFQKSINSLNVAGNIDEALKYATRAISYTKNDLYYRLMSDIYLARLNSLSLQKNITSETLSSQLEPIFRKAVENSKAAIDYDNTNYQNYLSLGRVYESVMPIEGAYKLASENYNNALKFNPRSPSINLMLARLETSNKNNAKAREYIIKSLQLKNNYTDAVFLLAQIEIAEGNIKDAIKLVEAGSTLTFDNPVVFFQLGILKYSDKEKDYKGAAEAFEKALALNSSYSNARYFLGLSYYNLGRQNDAIKQFEMVQSLNPDNKEVELILKNLKEGRAPFMNAEPPIDDKPEKRKTLPVKENETKETKKR